MGEEDTKEKIEPTSANTSSLEKPSEDMAGGKGTQEPNKDEEKPEPEKIEIDAENEGKGMTEDKELGVKRNEDDAETEKMDEDVTVTKDDGQAEATNMNEDAGGKKEQTNDGVSGGGTVEDTVMKENVESKEDSIAKDDEKKDSKETYITEADQKKDGKESEEDVKSEGEKANGTKGEHTRAIEEEVKLVDGDKVSERVENLENVDEYKKVETVDEDQKVKTVDKNEENGKEEDEEGKEEKVEAAKAKVENKEGSVDENDNEQVEHAKEGEKEERDDDKENENAEGGDDKEEEKEERKSSKRRGKGKSSGEKVSEKTKDAEPKTPFSDRPVRERKSVERLVAVIDRDSSKEFCIEKGPGAYLKDIPNVAYKVTRRKSDETLKLLHTILFARREKAAQVKTNILGFSGFVWHGNEEKAKEKIKEKFDKCIKEKLLEFCDMFDIHVTKATTKEEIITKLFEFLEKPPSDVPANEKDKSSKGAKRKRTPKKSSPAAGSSSSKRSVKRLRKSKERTKTVKKSLALSEDESEEEKEEDKKEKEQKSVEEEENENGIPDKSEDEAPQPSESEDESEEHSEEETPKKNRGSKLSDEKKESTGRARNKKASVAAKSSPQENDHQQNERREMMTVIQVQRRPLRGRGLKKLPRPPPPLQSLHQKRSQATFTDIIKELAKEFKDDLTRRKLSIKLMIQSELTKLAEEAENGEISGEERRGCREG